MEMKLKGSGRAVMGVLWEMITTRRLNPQLQGRARRAAAEMGCRERMLAAGSSLPTGTCPISRSIRAIVDGYHKTQKWFFCSPSALRPGPPWWQAGSEQLGP